MIEGQVCQPAHPGVQEPQHEGAGEVEAGEQDVDSEVKSGGGLPHSH